MPASNTASVASPDCVFVTTKRCLASYASDMNVQALLLLWFPNLLGSDFVLGWPDFVTLQ